MATGSEAEGREAAEEAVAGSAAAAVGSAAVGSVVEPAAAVAKATVVAAAGGEGLEVARETVAAAVAAARLAQVPVVVGAGARYYWETLWGRARWAGKAADLATWHLGRSTYRTRSMARGRTGTRSLKGPRGLPRRTTVFARLP